MRCAWREMSLAEVYPYWVAGDVPDRDMPYIACNDMLAGCLDDEIVALAGLTEHELDEVRDLAPRAFARLGLPPMTEDEAFRFVAPQRMRDVAERIVAGEEPPLHGANAIYFIASDAGFFSDAGEHGDLAYYGSELLQLADALEVRQDNPDQRRQCEELIIEAAQALLEGKPVPSWSTDGSWNLIRREYWASASI